MSGSKPSDSPVGALLLLVAILRGITPVVVTSLLAAGTLAMEIVAWGFRRTPDVLWHSLNLHI